VSTRYSTFDEATPNSNATRRQVHVAATPNSNATQRQVYVAPRAQQQGAQRQQVRRVVEVAPALQSSCAPSTVSWSRTVRRGGAIASGELVP
jgi:hypothetical protein